MESENYMEIINIDDCVFNFVYKMAMNDATMQLAYTGKKSDVLSVGAAKSHVREYIEKILAGDTMDFEKISNLLKKDFEDYEDFTFGNIQKLINMTVKYYYICTYTDEIMKSLFKQCDCPMDRVMITDVVARYKEQIDNDPIQKEKRIEYYTIGDKETSDWSRVSWSKIGFKNSNDQTSKEIYKKYQEMVAYLAKNKGISPIEYDFVSWE